MFQGLDESQLKGALEALLFVTDEPVKLLDLSDVLKVSAADVQQALWELSSDFDSEARGIVLREVAGGWRISTRPEYHELLEQYVLSWDTRKLSAAALETLAVVAYMQPVTRNMLSSVRGVNSDSTLNSLIEKGLVREVGTSDAPGNPMQYATTQVFLEKFGLRTTADLPDLEQFAPSSEAKKLIEQRLSAHKEEAYIADELLVSSGETGDDEDVLSRLSVRFDDGGVDSASTDLSDIAQTLAQCMSVVDKVNLDELTFETDDE